MTHQQSDQLQRLTIQFDVTLVPADEAAGDVAGYVAQGLTPVLTPSGGLAAVTLGGQPYNLVLGQPQLIGGPSAQTRVIPDVD
jgi:hypothetical protein